MAKSKTIELLEFWLPGYVVEFGINPNKVSLVRKEKRLIIDHSFAGRNFVVLLYLCYATTKMRECEQDVCKADRMAIDQLIAEGHTVDKQFYLDVLRILSDKNEMRVQVLKERLKGLPYGGS